MKGNKEMNKRKIFLTATTFLCTVLLAAGAFADGIKYTSHIKPIIDSKCLHCHGTESPELEEFAQDKARYKELVKGPRMDTYAFLIQFAGWPDAGALMRRLDDGQNTKDGKPGNMYEHLGDSEDERQKNLSIFKEWIGNWNLKKWPDVTKEEINKLNLAY